MNKMFGIIHQRTMLGGLVFFAFGVLSILPLPSSAITTTHYDKPALMHLNVSLSPSERQKRLLPYENFYIDHNFNRPVTSTEQYQHYQDPQQPPTRSEPNKPVLVRYVTSKKPYRPQIPQSTQNAGKFTPFSEFNALPGGFRPMMNSNNHPTTVKFEYLQDEQPNSEDDDDNVSPNFSAIYDKLAQLKLRQNALRKPYVSNPHTYQTIPIEQPVINYQQPQEEHRPYKIQPTKTTIETFTATNIDIPDADHSLNEEEMYQNYEPQKTYYRPEKPNPPQLTNTNAKPFIHQQIVIDLPPTGYAAQSYRKPYHPPPPPKTQIRKPVYVVQQPIQHQNVHYQRPKNPPRILYYKKKIPAPIVDEEYISEKYIPQKFEHLYQVTPQTEYEDSTPQYEPEPINDAQPLIENPNSLAHILKELQKNNALPPTLSADNIDNSIKTLVRILEELKQRQKLINYDNANPNFELVNNNQTPNRPTATYVDTENSVNSEHYSPDTPEGGTPGKPGVDYPALSSIPPTSFNCKTQRYKGFFGDPDTHCQVWHYCDLNGGQASFLCPNGTIFSQVALTCDWWYNVKCASTPQLYVLNERLYKYIIPLTPKFPEDYSGPLVDKYLALKFQEMEEKLRKQKKGKGNKSSEEEDEGSTEGNSSEDEEEEEAEDEDDDNEETVAETKKDEKISITKTNPKEIPTETVNTAPQMKK